MATTTECPDCGKFYTGRRCECGYASAPPTATTTWEQPEWMKRPPPCTPEEYYRALQLVKAILDGHITVEQSHRVLNEMFLGRELEL